MDYKKLLEPYSENGRTPEGQVSWLFKKGIPKSIIDQAQVFIYDELDRGKQYDNGHDLDRAFFDKAQEFMKIDVQAGIKQLEIFHSSLRQKWGEDLEKISKMAKVKKKWYEFWK